MEEGDQEVGKREGIGVRKGVKGGRAVKGSRKEDAKVQGMREGSSCACSSRMGECGDTPSAP